MDGNYIHNEAINFATFKSLAKEFTKATKRNLNDFSASIKVKSFEDKTKLIPSKIYNSLFGMNEEEFNSAEKVIVEITPSKIIKDRPFARGIATFKEENNRKATFVIK